MKIAIASDKKNIDSLVCKNSGRAPYYLIFENKILVKTIKNPFAVGGGGAGPSVAQMLFNENIDLVISANFGEKMIGILDAKKIDYKIISDKIIKEVINEI